MNTSKLVATLGGLMACVVGVGAAQADTSVCTDDRCSSSLVNFAYSDTRIDPFAYQSQWFPQNWKVQMRIGVRVLGETAVEMTGDMVARGTEPLEVGAIGRQGEGRLAFGYGVEVIPEVRIDVDLPGEGHFFWQGVLPTTALIPTDLMMDAETIFDPFALDDEVHASGETQRVRVYSYGIDESLIPLRGVSGKIALEIKAGLDVAYQSRELALRGAAPLLTSDATQPFSPTDSVGYGAGLEVAVQPRGLLRYTGTLTLYPQFRVKILGITVGKLDLFTLPLEVFHKDVHVSFAVEEAYLALADMAVEFDTIAVLPGASTQVAITNRGDAPLVVLPRLLPDTLRAAEITVAPGERRALTFMSTAEFAGADVILYSNDPDQPEMFLTVVASAEEDAAEAGKADKADEAGQGATVGGCNTGGGQELPALLLVLLAGIFGLRRSERPRKLRTSSRIYLVRLRGTDA